MNNADTAEATAEAPAPPTIAIDLDPTHAAPEPADPDEWKALLGWAAGEGDDEPMTRGTLRGVIREELAMANAALFERITQDHTDMLNGMGGCGGDE